MVVVVISELSVVGEVVVSICGGRVVGSGWLGGLCNVVGGRGVNIVLNVYCMYSSSMDVHFVLRAASIQCSSGGPLLLVSLCCVRK